VLTPGDRHNRKFLGAFVTPECERRARNAGMACSVSRQRLAGDGVGVPSIPLGNAYLCFIEVAEIQLSQFDCALGPNTDPVLHH
jgi:hypothetical protein